MSTRQLLGRGLSYQDLIDAPRDGDIRAEWAALADVADTLGLPVMSASGGTRTIDELVDTINDALPEGMLVEHVLEGTENSEPYLKTTHSYQVQHLRQVGPSTGRWEWVPFFPDATEEEARKVKAECEESGEGFYRIVEKRTSWTVLP